MPHWSVGCYWSQGCTFILAQTRDINLSCLSGFIRQSRVSIRDAARPFVTGRIPKGGGLTTITIRSNRCAVTIEIMIPELIGQDPLQSAVFAALNKEDTNP